MTLDDKLADSMTAAAGELVALVGPPLPYPFDDSGRRWIEYRPRTRPGVSLADLEVPARKAAYRLLATGLSPTRTPRRCRSCRLEEVLDRSEGFARGRHLEDYWVSIFGTPGSADPWSWRFEGHHLSVSMTVVGSAVSPAPVFFGANPARVSYGAHTVSRPLAPEEDVAFALLAALSPTERLAGGVRGRAAGRRAQRDLALRVSAVPSGVSATSLNPAAGALLASLVGVYLDRLPSDLADELSPSLEEIRFAWAGPERPGTPHYYRIQAADLLIEYDNTAGGNHAHTVLRRPRPTSARTCWPSTAGRTTEGLTRAADTARRSCGYDAQARHGRFRPVQWRSPAGFPRDGAAQMSRSLAATPEWQMTPRARKAFIGLIVGAVIVLLAGGAGMTYFEVRQDPGLQACGSFAGRGGRWNWTSPSTASCTACSPGRRRLRCANTAYGRSSPAWSRPAVRPFSRCCTRRTRRPRPCVRRVCPRVRCPTDGRVSGVNSLVSHADPLLTYLRRRDRVAHGADRARAGRPGPHARPRC